MLPTADDLLMKWLLRVHIIHFVFTSVLHFSCGIFKPQEMKIACVSGILHFFVK